MNKKQKILAIILSVCFLIPCLGIETLAASGVVSISSTSGNVGSTVTISCTAKCQTGPIGTADVTLQYDPSGLEYVGGSGGYSLTGGSGSVRYSGLTQDGTATSLSFTVKFKIIKPGTYTINGTAQGLDIEENNMAMSVGSGTITGKAVTTPSTPSTPNPPSGGNNDSGDSGDNQTQDPEDTRDKNSKLSGLRVSPGSLAPAFSSNTTSYTVTVPKDTTSVTISATAQSSKARVSVSGGKDLKLGPNEAQVIVTAEDGSTTVYKLTIMCGELEKITIDGQVYLINEGFADDKIPAGFVRGTVTYKEREYQVVSHEKSGMKLMNLKNDEVGSAFYIYSPESQTFYNFVQIQIAEGKTMIPLPLDDTAQFADNEKTTLTLQGKTFESWKVDEDYSLIKLMNSNGEEIVYQYDKVDGTLQRYAGPVVDEPVEQEPVEEPEEPKTFLDEYALYIIIGLGALTVILAIAMIYFIATRRHRHEARKRKVQKRLEKEAKREIDEL